MRRTTTLDVGVWQTTLLLLTTMVKHLVTITAVFTSPNGLQHMFVFGSSLATIYLQVSQAVLLTLLNSDYPWQISKALATLIPISPITASSSILISVVLGPGSRIRTTKNVH